MKTPRLLRTLTSSALALVFGLAVVLVAGGGSLHAGVLVPPTPSTPASPAATPTATPTPTREPAPRPTPTPTQEPAPRSHPSSRGLDSRCRTGRVICVDKTSRSLRWVVDGRALRTLDARFGGPSTPTREGEFTVFAKSRDHVSSLYDTSMPFAMFFSGGQAVHYSPDFAAVGYDGASHGCVNVRDRAGVEWLFDQVLVGDRVVVWRS